jgi:hypothetical protein
MCINIYITHVDVLFVAIYVSYDIEALANLINKKIANKLWK